MINFDSLSLKALISEIEPILTEGRVQKVQQPSKNELLLTVRALRETRKLYICVDPKYPHAALLSAKGEELRNINIPQKPPMFCMLLRKHLEGCKINAVSSPNFDRILEIRFDSYSELGEKLPMVLACEFMGKYSNLILYTEQEKIIQGCAHFVSSEKSRERELAGGYTYVYPPKQNKIDLNSLSKQEFSARLKILDAPVNIWLNEKFGFISKALATEICNFLGIDTSENKITAISQEKLSELYDLLIETVNFENINPSISRDKKVFSIIGVDKNIDWQRYNSVNEVIDLYFGYQVFNDKFSRLKNYVSKVLKGELKKLKGQLENIGEDEEKKLAKEEKMERYRQYGDIIMANLYKIANNAEFAEVENFFDENKIIKIPLDKMLSASENAQKYYKLYNKAKNAAVYAKELSDKIYTEIDYLEGIKESVNHAESLADLKEIEQELIAQNLIKSNGTPVSKKGKQETIKLTGFVSSDGFEILLGKNNKQNDFLLKIASPEDIWLHTQNIHGSHVLIKLPQNITEVSETALHEAVYIAAYYSQARESSNVPVVYTRKKFVKKPAGSKPGFVIFTHEKTLWVNPDESKLPALK
jgi:predicted ribosome quality control (RQC) complex YloA/Tae2 family protein